MNIQLATRIALVIFLLASTIATAQVDVLRLASDPWPPFTGKEKENAIAISIVEEALSRVGTESTNEIVEFEDVLEGIRLEKYDGSAALWESEDRKELMIFSIPYLHNQLVLVGRKGSDVSAMDFGRLKGKKIAIVGTYAYGESVEKATDVEFVKGKSDQDNLEKLLRNEVDYMLADALLVQYVLTYQREAAAQFLAIAKDPIITKSLHFALWKELPQAKETIALFNEAIMEMAKDGSYNRILQLDWISADIDGDGQMELVLKGNKAGTTAPTSGYDIYFQKSAIMGSDNQYYIDGKMYNGWDTVPAKYKQAPQSDQAHNRSELLKLKF